VVSKVHHALLDGLASVKLMKRLFDRDPGAPGPEPPPTAWAPALLPSPQHRFNRATREMMAGQVDAADAMMQAFRAPRELADRKRRLLEGVGKIAGPPGRQIVATPWNTGAMSEAHDLVWFRSSVRDYRAIRKAFGGTTNDVVLTVLTEGAGRYLKDHGYSTNGWFRVASPVNVRQPEEPTDWGNRVSMMFPTLPATPMDPVERLRVVHQETGRISPDELRTLDRLGLRWTGGFRSDPNTGFPNGVFTLTSLSAMAPPNLTALTSRMELLGMQAATAFKRMTDWRPRPGNLSMQPAEISFVATYVPSVPAPIYLCGHRCLEQVGVLPVGGNLGYGVAVLSYNHDRYFAISADPKLMPDIDRMKGHVQAAFEELKLAADRKRPTETPGKQVA
jgi:hypothetical protein